MKKTFIPCDFAQAKFAVTIVALIRFLYPSTLLAAPPTITYVQGNYATPKTPQTTLVSHSQPRRSPGTSMWSPSVGMIAAQP